MATTVCVGHVSVAALVLLAAVRGEFVRRGPPPARATLLPSYRDIRVTRELCEDLYPPGYRYPQRTRSPFSISVDWDETPDINIYVDSPHSLSFEGMILQMRSDVTKEPIGSMCGYGSQAPIQSITCVQDGDTAYLASRRWRQSESVYWYAPPGFNRTEHRLTLFATVVLGPYIFWNQEVQVPPGTQDPYVFDENEPTVAPPRKRRFKGTYESSSQ